VFNIGEELLAVRRTIKSARRPHTGSTQSGHKGDRFPMPLWHSADEALTTPTTTAQTRHLRIGGGLVDKNQPGRIKHALFSHPAPSCPGHVGPFLLRCAQAFFERDVMTLKETPNSGTAATVSARMRHTTCVGGCLFMEAKLTHCGAARDSRC
jgi:hypothetical protein